MNRIIRIENAEDVSELYYALSVLDDYVLIEYVVKETEGGDGFVLDIDLYLPENK